MTKEKLTLKRLRKFIAIRNQSNFDSNLQFSFDASAAGFSVTELGQAKHLPRAPKIGGRYWSFYWETPFGILVEHYGKLRLFTRKP